MTEERTVYIIGAGFSHGYDEELFPVMNKMFTKRYLRYSVVMDAEEQVLLKTWFGEHFFDGLENIDVEEAFSYCELIRNGPVNIGQAQDKYILADRLEEVLKKYLHHQLEFSIRNSNADYKNWIQRISARDCIITFNYDWLIEGLILINTGDESGLMSRMWAELEGANDNYSTFRREDYSGILLKLHGSLSWYTCSNSKCKDYSNILVNDSKGVKSDNNPQVYLPKLFSPDCRICSSRMTPVIIYPGMSKRYEKYPKIGRLWNIANTALSKANRVVTIGYSFRHQDVSTTFLLRNSIGQIITNNDKDWIIIDKESKKVQERLIYLLPRRSNEIEKAKTFEDLADYMQNRP